MRDEQYYKSRLTEEDIRDAERKYPLADIPLSKLAIPMLILTVVMVIVGVFIL